MIDSPTFQSAGDPLYLVSHKHPPVCKMALNIKLYGRINMTCSHTQSTAIGIAASTAGGRKGFVILNAAQRNADAPQSSAESEKSTQEVESGCTERTGVGALSVVISGTASVTKEFTRTICSTLKDNNVVISLLVDVFCKYKTSQSFFHLPRIPAIRHKMHNHNATKAELLCEQIFPAY